MAPGSSHGRMTLSSGTEHFPAVCYSAEISKGFSLSLTLCAYPELAGGLCSLCQRARELWKVLWWQHTPTLPDRPGHMLLTNHRGHRCKPSKSLEWDRTRIIWQRALTIIFHKIITYYLENYRLSLANVCLLTSHKLGNTLNSE